jgi:predicted XRE-type DNA-binding protein
VAGIIEDETPADGNIFADLGFPPQEAANLLMRSKLMLRVRRVMKERKLTQSKAAKLFGVSQPRVSDVVRGKINLFSIDALISMLSRAGIDVDLVFKPRKAA